MRYVIPFILSLGLALPAQAEVNDGEKFVNFMGFTLSSGTTLNDVQAKLGKAKAFYTGDAGGSETRICYIADHGIVSFLSAEMGDEKELLEVDVRPTTTEASKCSRMPKKYYKQIPEDAGLHLGLTRKAFENLVGGKVEWKKNKGLKLFESKQRIGAVDYDVSVSIAGKFSGDRLMEFKVLKVISN